MEGLNSPLARSCHVGNNTSNVWGMLSMFPNSFLLLYDHTVYSLDENCFPWLVLDSKGSIANCYDHKGNPASSWNGCAVNHHLKTMERKPNILNYGIYAEHEGVDLFTWHYNQISSLSNRLNGSEVLTDSQALLQDIELLSSVITYSAENKALDLLFNRWVSISKRGNTTIQSISDIAYKNGEVQITVHDHGKVFSGRADKLIHLFVENISIVANRTSAGERAVISGYPWFTLGFAYIVTTMREAKLSPAQKDFYHAGGSSSQYYINNQVFQSEFTRLWTHLGNEGFLPSDGQLSMIPTFCCQLFATSQQGKSYINQLLDIWDDFCSRNAEQIELLVDELSVATSPSDAAASATTLLNPNQKKEIKSIVLLFNGVDKNKLPVAHISQVNRINYNKFGAPMKCFFQTDFFWPRDLQNYSWANIELFLKVISELFCDDPEAW